MSKQTVCDYCGKTADDAQEDYYWIRVVHFPRPPLTDKSTLIESILTLTRARLPSIHGDYCSVECLLKIVKDFIKIRDRDNVFDKSENVE